MMRLFLVLGLVGGCYPIGNVDTDADTGSDSDTAADGGEAPCVPPGLEDWQPTTEAPVAGDTIHSKFLVGICGLGTDLNGHWSTLYQSPGGDVYCAVTWAFGSTGDRGDCADCELAWEPRWELPTDHGSEFCVDVGGYDPASIDLSFYEGMGIGNDDLVWVKEEDFSWEPIIGSPDRTDGDDSILLEYTSAGTL